jgi:uncharacterized membrane protein
MIAILFSSLMAIAALAVDFGRLGNLKADLQSSADAAALAGALELFFPDPSPPFHDPTLADDSATAYALRNPAMQGNVNVVSVVCGTWLNSPGVFSNPAPCSGSTNAIQVTVSRQPTGLFMAILGVSPGPVYARATGAVGVAVAPDKPVLVPQ